MAAEAILKCEGVIAIGAFPLQEPFFHLDDKRLFDDNRFGFGNLDGTCFGGVVFKQEEYTMETEAARIVTREISDDRPFISSRLRGGYHHMWILTDLAVEGTDSAPLFMGFTKWLDEPRIGRFERDGTAGILGGQECDKSEEEIGLKARSGGEDLVTHTCIACPTDCTHCTNVAVALRFYPERIGDAGKATKEKAVTY